jgi:hypothetical protein
MVSIQFAGGHLDQVPPYAETIITAVGITMLNWARLEQQIDALLICVNKAEFTTEKYIPMRSVSFRAKLDLFERWFVKDRRFEQRRERAERLLEAFKNASADRNLLAHSNVQRFEEGPRNPARA